MTIVTARLHSLWLTIHSVKVVSNAGNFTIPVRWPFGCFATASFFFSPVSDHGIVYFSPSSMLLDYILHSNGWNWTGPMEPWTIFGPFFGPFLQTFFEPFLDNLFLLFVIAAVLILRACLQAIRKVLIHKREYISRNACGNFLTHRKQKASEQKVDCHVILSHKPAP